MLVKTESVDMTRVEVEVEVGAVWGLRWVGDWGAVGDITFSFSRTECFKKPRQENTHDPSLRRLLRWLE